MRKWFIVLLPAIGVGLLVWRYASSAQPVVTLANRSHAAYRSPYDPGRIVAEIEFLTMRVHRDPLSALDFAALAAAYLQRGRETGDNADYVRAEEAARRSIKIRTRANERGFLVLGQALMGQHRFRDAMHNADTAVRALPQSRELLRMKAEVQLELGQIADSDKTLSLKSPAEISDEDMVVKARKLTVTGQPGRALELLKRVITVCEQSVDIRSENLAWLYVREGELFVALGRTEEADLAFRNAINVFPTDYRAMAGLARMFALTGDALHAVEWGEKSAAIVPQPEVLSILEDAYLALGRTEDAHRCFRLIEAIAKLSKVDRTIFDRQRAIYLADHDRQLDEAMSLARNEITMRQDAITWDTLGWVSLKMGNLTEASHASSRALAQNPSDSRILMHHALIASAQNAPDAREKLANSLKLYPKSLLFPAPTVRKMLGQVTR